MQFFILVAIDLIEDHKKSPLHKAGFFFPLKKTISFQMFSAFFHAPHQQEIYLPGFGHCVHQ